MNLFSRNGSRFAALVTMAGCALAITVARAADLPPITPATVASSLEQNAAAWSAKIDALGRPRLLFDKTSRQAAKDRLLAEPTSPAVKSLLANAYALAPSIPRAYVSPEEKVRKGETAYGAGGEEWIRVVGDEIVMLTIASALDPSPLLKQALHDAVVTACSYPSWGRASGLPANNMDLACAHMTRAVALAWDWFPELWVPSDRELILKTVDERAGSLLSGLYGKAFWARGYGENHNHVNCNGLAWAGLAFYTDLPKAPEWLAAARLDFQNVARVFPADGSSPEGVPYWSYGISYILQYIEGTRGVIDSGDLYDAPFLRNAASYRLNMSTSGLGSTLPWGDTFTAQDASQPILNRLALEYKDSSAAWLASNLPWKVSGADALAWMALWQPKAGSQPPLPLDYHQWVADIVTTRSGWGEGDYLLAIKSGFTNRNHSHLDAGALALAFGSDWILTAPGYGKGKNSPDYWDINIKRWTFFANATESHCALLIDGQNQRSDMAARGTIDTFLSTPFLCWTGVDLTQAYKNVLSVRREVLHRRADYILVFDAVTPKQPASVEWLAQLPNDPEIAGNALNVKTTSGRLRVEMISPATPFVSRAPTSPHVDVPGQFSTVGIHTYAVKNSGETVKFIALLQPGFGSDALPELTASLADQKTGYAHLVIKGGDWTDDIFKSDLPEPMPMNTETISRLGVKAIAGTLVIRTQKQAVTSLLALRSTSVTLPGIEITPTTAAQIGLQRTPDGAWILDSDQDLDGKVKTTFSIQPLERKRTAFRYLLATKGTTTAQASAWLDSLLTFREKAPLPVRAPAPQPMLQTPMVIPIEAEAFVSQAQGKAEVVAGKPGATGKSVRGFGNGTPDHVLVWSFTVPRAGQYQLTLRYTTNAADVTAALLLDDAAPSRDLLKVSLPSTGGWSIKESNWKDLVVSDHAGKPFIFPLSEGTHTVALAKPTGALALDRLEFSAVPPSSSR